MGKSLTRSPVQQRTLADAATWPEPFVKWAGGKRSLLRQILPHVPERIGTYFEPFVGGGALFWMLAGAGRIDRARLNDCNERLIRTYRAIQSDANLVIRRLRRCRNDEAFFLRMRKRQIDQETDDSVAAWLIYLNRTCFNGLYRVNKKGEFNVPFGDYPNPNLCNDKLLRACERALSETVFARLSHVDFAAATRTAKPGDFVYFDPPYYPRRAGIEFTAYDASGFGHKDHVRLRDTALTLKKAGVNVLLSNSGADEVRELYAGFEFEEVKGARNIAASAARRIHAPDLLIW